MATTTNTLALRKPATTDSVNVETDLNTPYDTIDDQFQKGSDVASATSITVPDEGYFDITGTTTTAGFSTVNAGIMKMVQFDGALQLTHNSGSFNLPTGANITTAAGDRALFRSEGSGNWRCMWYQRASGAALKIADESIDSDAFVDGSVDTAHVADNQITLAKLSDGTQGGVLYYGASGAPTELAAGTDGYVLATNGGSANPAWEQVSGTGIAAEAIDSDHYVDGSIDTAHIADNQVTLGKLSDGTQGGILYYASGGAPTELAAGTSGYYLKTQGGSANPVWASVSAGPSQASESALEAETNEDTYAPPDLIRHSPGVAKFWIKAGYDASVLASYNVTSVTDVGTGLITVTIADDFTSASWAVTACTETPYTRSTNVAVPSGSGQLAGSVAFRITDNNGTLSDGTYLHIAGWGTQ